MRDSRLGIVLVNCQGINLVPRALVTLVSVSRSAGQG